MKNEKKYYDNNVNEAIEIINSKMVDKKNSKWTSVVIKEAIKLYKKIDEIELNETLDENKKYQSILDSLISPDKKNEGVLFSTGYFSYKQLDGAVARNNENDPFINFIDRDSPSTIRIEQLIEEFSDNEDLEKIELMAKTMFWINRTAKHFESFECKFASRKTDDVNKKTEFWKKCISKINENRTRNNIDLENILIGKINDEDLLLAIKNTTEQLFQDEKFSKLKNEMSGYLDNEILSEFKSIFCVSAIKGVLYHEKEKVLCNILDIAKNHKEELESDINISIKNDNEKTNNDDTFNTIVSIFIPYYSIPIEVHSKREFLEDRYGKTFIDGIEEENIKNPKYQKPHLLFMLNATQQKNTKKLLEKENIPELTKIQLRKLIGEYDIEKEDDKSL